MKKLTALLLITMLLAVLPISVFANSDGASWGEVPLYTGDIDLDGEKDDVYDEGLIVKINNRTDGIKGGATADAYMLWGSGKFYVFFDVNDADIVKYDAARSNWQNEGVEFTLDFKNDGSNRSKVTIVMEPNICAPSGDAPEKIGASVCKRTSHGYSVELIYDLSQQSVQAPKAGVAYGINMLVNDMTGTDTRGIIRTTHKNNPTENEVAKFDYIVLGSEEVGIEIIEEETEAPAASGAKAPVTAAKTADLMLLPMLVLAVSGMGVTVISRKK